ncbi:MAG: histone deacetylase [Syntrophobacterales bacterium]|jgi:acetoin utilization deacetylase AcuC-like enzyme|nr:histone deacetylase [Syntrophobacterales bacterium]
MRRTGYVYDERYLRHDPGSWHPERPDRLKAIQKNLAESGLLELVTLIKPYEAPLAWVEKLHDPDYIQRFKRACAQGLQIFEVADCGICPESYDIALLAAGGVMAAVDAVMNGQVDNVFCAVRPPGHHAERDRAMGFCFFNNVALGALYALENYGLERVAIVDWDVHHGNGTQHLFESDPRVFYLSLHEDPQHCYPGTGYRRETGKGKGEGFTLNLPFPPRSVDEEYLEALRNEALPRLRQFAPQLVFISAGFDAHENDPLAHEKLSRQAFRDMGQLVLDLARESAEGRLITVLEGGYNLEVLEDCTEDHLRLLLDVPFDHF